jgi:hypothetical protein
MKNKKRSLITVDLSGCKNYKECEKVIYMLTSGQVKLNVSTIN